MSEKTSIITVQRKSEIDFTNDKIQSVWNRNNKPAKLVGKGSLLLAGEDGRLVDQLFSIIANANDVILIGTPNLSHPEVVSRLLEAAGRGVRVYIHIDTAGFDRMRKDVTSRSLMGHCLARERTVPGLDCVICDGNQIDAEGLLLTTPLDSNLASEKSGWALALNKEQISELERRYTHDFWVCRYGREILAEEEVDDPPLICDKPYSIVPLNNREVMAMASLCSGEPTSNAAKKIQKAKMDSIIAFDDMPTTPFGSVVIDLMRKQSTVMVKSPFVVKEETKSLSAHSSSQLHVAIGPQVSVIAGWDRSAGTTWGSMLILDDSQSQDALKIIETANKSPEWTFHKECSVGKLSKDIWFEGKQRKVMDHKKVDLGVIEVDEVNLELIESHEPEIPRSEELIRKTDYHWISSPPLAPEGAKDDLLVVSWNKSIETIIAELTRLDRIKPKTSMFGFKGKAKEIEKRINAVRDSLSDVSTKQNLSELVEEVNEISTIIDDTSSGIQQAEQEALDEKEKEKQLEHWEQLVSKAKNRATELTPRLKKKKSQLSDLEKKLKKAEGVKAQQVGSDIETLNNEVSLLDMEHKEAIQTSKKKFEFTPPSKSLKPEGKGKSARAKGNVFVSSEQSRPRFKVVIPEEDLPEVGTLVSAESKRYLAISFVEDIPIGIKEAKRLKASLCCPREVIS